MQYTCSQSHVSLSLTIDVFEFRWQRRYVVSANFCLNKPIQQQRRCFWLFLSGRVFGLIFSNSPGLILKEANAYQCACLMENQIKTCFNQVALNHLPSSPAEKLLTYTVCQASTIIRSNYTTQAKETQRQPFSSIRPHVSTTINHQNHINLRSIQCLALYHDSEA